MSTISKVEFFAQYCLSLFPVSAGEAKGFWGLRSNKRGKTVKFHVSHEYIIHLYSSVNRFMRDKHYDSQAVMRVIDTGEEPYQGPYLRFERKVEGQSLRRYVRLTPGMETLFDIPLTGGKW